MKLASAAFATLLLVCGPALAADLEDPAPIAVAAQTDPALVAKAIHLGVAARGWSVVQEEPGALVVEYTPRIHVARVRVAYDASKISIQYVASVNLAYKEHDGQREIHRAYNGWVSDLAESIAGFLSRSDLAALAAPAQVSAAGAAVAADSGGDGEAPTAPLLVTPMTRIIGPHETVSISAVTPYADGVGRASVRKECDWNTQFAPSIAEFSRLQVVQVPDSRALSRGLVLDLSITSVHATGGGRFGGPKWARIHAELRDGAQQLAQFNGNRTTGSGFSACGALDKLGRALARDISDWLVRPTPVAPAAADHR